MFYFYSLANIMYDVSRKTAPNAILNLFTQSRDTHVYPTRSSSKGNYQIKYSRLEIQKNSFSRRGARVWNSIPPTVRSLPKTTFRSEIQKLLTKLLQTENIYHDCESIIKIFPKFLTYP